MTLIATFIGGVIIGIVAGAFGCFCWLMDAISPFK